jgi:signal transduction histidine kinase/archaellum biogenesis ATPase FlaH
MAIHYDANPQRFGVSAIDSVFPDGMPVPYTLLIAADPGCGSDILLTDMIHEHLSGNREAKVLWLSLEHFVDDLRNMTCCKSLSYKNQIEFIDCYSSQICIDGNERYSADPSNLPELGVVTSTAISEVMGEGSLLVVLDSLSALIQKVGVRCSTEFFKTLVAKTRSISANLLTTLNRGAFTEAVLATFAGMTNIVLELAMHDAASTGGMLRVRKASNVKHVKTWFPYEIDFDEQTLRCDVMKAVSNNAERFPEGLTKFAPQQLTAPNATKERPSLTCERVGQFCSVGGRTLAERERIAVMSEALSAVEQCYSIPIQTLLYNLYVAKKGMSPKEGATLEELARGFSEQMQRTSKYLSHMRDRNKIKPMLQESSIKKMIQRAIEDATIPSSIKVQIENGSKDPIMVDRSMITRSLTGVIDAAMHEMPTGGLLSIRDDLDLNENVTEIVVENTGISRWKDNTPKIFDPETPIDASVGLELVIAKQFIEAHRGELQIRCNEGKGSMFIIRLPHLFKLTSNMR